MALVGRILPLSITEGPLDGPEVAGPIGPLSEDLYAGYGFQFFVRGKPATRVEFFENLPDPHLGLAENIFLSWQQNEYDFQCLHDKLSVTGLVERTPSLG
jgi:hypothetical protein